MDHTENFEEKDPTKPGDDASHEVFYKGNINIDTSAFFNLMFANSQSAAILILDEKGNVMNCNLGFQNVLGYKPEEIIGRNFTLLYTKEDRLKKLPEMELATIFQKGSAQDNNYAVHKDGAYIWVHGESIFTKNPKGQIFIIKLIFDINHQKLLEKFLTEANEKLNATMKELQSKNDVLNLINKDLDNFVYTASHDLKAPINNIQSLVSALEDCINKEAKKDCKELIEMINTSIQKFQTTIEDLSVIGRAQEEGLKDVQEISFEKMLAEVKFNLHDEIEKAQPIIMEDIAKAPVINFSRKNLRSILHNLISNSIKYRSPDRRLNIKIETDKTNEFFIVKVCDNGLGIKEEDKEKVFRIYSRIHTHVEGSGVGMAIVSRIVGHNGGKIEIESTEGEGATFKIFLRA